MQRSPAQEAQDAVEWLRRHGTKRARDGMARYAIQSDKAFGVSVGAIQQLGKRLGQDHDLAAALWKTGWYEARMLAAFARVLLNCFGIKFPEALRHRFTFKVFISLFRYYFK